MYKGLVGLTFVVLLVLNSAIFIPHAIAGDAPKPDVVVAKHLESIGTAKARSGIKSRADEGTVEFRILSGAVGGATTGNSVFLSEGRKTLFMMKFPTVEYSGERFIFDGNRMEVRAATAHQNETRYRLEERFSDFAAVDSLTLPMHYTLQFTHEQKTAIPCCRNGMSSWMQSSIASRPTRVISK